MNVPMHSAAFERFIQESQLFARTQLALLQCLKSWYADDPEQFTEDLRADLDTVLHSYRFENVMVSLNKNYNFDPPLDTISGKITIYDEEGSYCMNYQAIFDYDLQLIDDITGR